ncbi:MAG: hypothetical protein JST68_03205 [Bacteroidetes bacterium]|nr:hypothetical protein [Bacteroidota bacterium]
MSRLKETALLAAILSISLLSCKKSDDVNPPVEHAPRLSVRLTEQYLQGSNIDSAWVTWKTDDQIQRIGMQLRKDSLIADIHQLKEGVGELKIHLFSNKKINNQYPTQWVLTKKINLRHASPASYAGPVSFFDSAWLPRVALKDGIGHKGTVGLRPEDPYFLIEDLQPALYSLTVDKGYWNTIGGISWGGGKTWTCAGECIRNRKTIEDESFFGDIPGRIGAKSWNHISIVILYEIDKNGGGWTLSLEYEP